VKKKLAIVFGSLVILLVVAVVVVFMSIDAIAKTAIERGSTYALGVQTTLDSADIGILSGEFRMKGLNVANPEGFTSDTFFRLGEGFVAVSLGSLRQDTVELPTLALSGVQMNLEKKGGSSNFGVITDNLKRFESPAGGSAKPGKSFIIREIVITDINVTVDLLPIGGTLNRIEVPIEQVRLTDVGNDGLTTAEMTALVIKAIMAAVVANAGDLPADLVNDLGGALGNLASLKDLGITQIVDIKELKQAQDVAKSVDDAIKGLGSLFGGKKPGG